MHRGSAALAVRLLLLRNIIKLLLHARSTSEDGRGILLDQLLRQDTGLLLDVGPLLWILLNGSILLHRLFIVHLHIVVLVGILGISILLEREKPLHLLKLLQRRTIASLIFQFLQMFLGLLGQLSDLVLGTFLVLQAHHLNSLIKFPITHGVQVLQVLH